MSRTLNRVQGSFEVVIKLNIKRTSDERSKGLKGAVLILNNEQRVSYVGTE
jgi:hypothetical protein